MSLRECKSCGSLARKCAFLKDCSAQDLELDRPCGRTAFSKSSFGLQPTLDLCCMLPRECNSCGPLACKCAFLKDCNAESTSCLRSNRVFDVFFGLQPALDLCPLSREPTVGNIAVCCRKGHLALLLFATSSR